MPRDCMNGVDIAVLLAEIRDLVEGSYVDNVYLLDKHLIIKLRGGGLSRELIVKHGKAIYMTGFERVKPVKPPSFAMLLRKYILGLKVSELTQRAMERIIAIQLEGERGRYRLILELFGAGNLILTDEDYMVKAVMRRSLSSKSGVVKPGGIYEYPPALKDPREVSMEDLAEVRNVGSRSIQRALSKVTGLPSPYAEEVLVRSGIDPSIRPDEFSEENDLIRVYKNIRAFLEEVFHKPVKPVVYRDEKGSLVDLSPIPLVIYRNLRPRFYETFTEAVDTYFTELDECERALEKRRRVEAEAERYRRALNEQMEMLRKLTKEAERYRAVGMLLMSKLHVFQRLTPRFEDIIYNENVKEAEEALKQSLAEEGFKLLQVEMDGRLIQLEGFGVRFKFDTRLSAAENASRFYTLAKKAEEKARRIREAMKKIEKKVEKVEAKEKVLKPRKSGAWYERFRYTFTKDSFLIVGGKDASTNELLIKHYMEPKDLVFHAEYAGSPFVLLKTGGQTATSEAIWEASVFTACYSRAWTDGLANLDVFYVKPDQVSKKPPSGEYLPRGSFMVKGVKSYVRKVPLRLCIGFKVNGDDIEIIIGSEEGVKNEVDAYVVVSPGKVDKRRLAEMIKRKVENRLSKKVLREVKLPINEVYRLIPGNGGMLEDC